MQWLVWYTLVGLVLAVGVVRIFESVAGTGHPMSPVLFVVTVAVVTGTAGSRNVSSWARKGQSRISALRKSVEGRTHA